MAYEVRAGPGVSFDVRRVRKAQISKAIINGQDGGVREASTRVYP